MLFFRRDNLLSLFYVFCCFIFLCRLCNLALQLFCQHINNKELNRRRTAACVNGAVAAHCVNMKQFS